MYVVNNIAQIIAESTRRSNTGVLELNVVDYLNLMHFLSDPGLFLLIFYYTVVMRHFETRSPAQWIIYTG
jgi:hypothetical protein